MRYETVLFDLDGTLTDPGVGITNSVAYALEKYGIKEGDRRALYKFIGPPLHESFELFYGFSKEMSMEAVAFYREYYSGRGIFECVVYEGVKELLSRLKDAGTTLLVATSKPEMFARMVLGHFGLMEYFDYVAGANMDGTRTKKDEVIRYAMTEGNVWEVSAALMVGDREYDVLGAKRPGIASAGVLYGYGGFEELTRAGADYVVEEAGEIAGIVLGY